MVHDDKTIRYKITYLVLLFSVVLLYLIGTIVSRSWLDNNFVGKDICQVEDVKCKIEDAQRRYTAMLIRQSRTPEEAEKEYKRRYRRSPPRGFKQWAEFAIENNSTIIDDFDQIERDFNPFRKLGLSSSELLNRISSAKINAPGEMLGMISIRDGEIIAFGNTIGPMSTNTLETIIKPISSRLPNMIIPFNWYSEPRVLYNHKSIDHEIKSGDTLNTIQMRDRLNITFEEQASRSSLEDMYHLCKSLGAESKSFSSHHNMDFDFCATDFKELKTAHGFFIAPDQFRPTRKLFPLLSRAKFSVFDDILVPNVCYAHEDYRGQTTQRDTIPFSQKQKDLYWRGATTGISMKEDIWAKGHRAKLALYMMQLRKASRKLGKVEEKDIMQEEEKLLELPNGVGGHSMQAFDWENKKLVNWVKHIPAKVFNIAFYLIANTDEAIERTIRQHFYIVKRDSPVEEHKHQFLADFDGQSMSCRFYRLLQTNSVVFKQTIWNEWHNERLFPWLHYIPIGLDLSKHEVLMVLNYFLNIAGGQEHAMMIAEESRKVTEQSLRSIDLTIYYYRVLLEYASLFQN